MTTSSNKLIILDTTLRDGEQSPGILLSPQDKLTIALQLEKLGVDVIEAGFAASSKDSFTAIETIAHNITDSTICSLARAKESDIQCALEALKSARSKRIHIFIATSDIHIEKKLHTTQEHVLEQAVHAVQYARQYTDDIQFCAEDAYRSSQDFLCTIIEAVIKAGATTINIPDTVGYALPELYGACIYELRQRIPCSDQAIWAAHCHNDLGLAVANTLAGIKHGGARQVECTINGIGERAGNASLEEIIMTTITHHDYFNVSTRIHTPYLLETSQLVSTLTGFIVPPNKAIVGANAFRHTSGIHQDGILKDKRTYEIMRPEDIGWDGSNISLSKLSGKNALKHRLHALGITPTEEYFNTIYAQYKIYAEHTAIVSDKDIRALIAHIDLL